MNKKSDTVHTYYAINVMVILIHMYEIMSMAAVVSQSQLTYVSECSGCPSFVRSSTTWSHESSRYCSTVLPVYM